MRCGVVGIGGGSGRDEFGVEQLLDCVVEC